jgi:hypothetical protein
LDVINGVKLKEKTYIWMKMKRNKQKKKTALMMENELCGGLLI